MMRESAGDAFQQAAIDQFIEQLDNLPTQDYQQQLAESEEGVPRVRLVSARALTEKNTARVERFVAQVAGQPVEIRYDVDPSLVAGAALRLGDIIVDGSMSGQLQQLKERYMQDLEQQIA
jgi:F-type H+-transporting ATPase subunit delta